MDQAVAPTCDEQLLELVKEISLRDFGLPFRHGCRFNPRLRTSGGRYLLRSHDIECNPKQVQEYGYDELVGTIRHELCHYHLHLGQQGYRHRDHDFRALLEKVGGARYARPLAVRTRLPERYVYVCIACQKQYPRKRRMNTNRYVCGVCQGLLALTQESKER